MTEHPFPALRAALADVVTIPVTPFAADGTVDEKAMRILLRRIIDGGIATLTPNGNIGEFYALTPEERRRAVEVSVEEAAGAATIVATAPSTASRSPRPTPLATSPFSPAGATAPIRTRVERDGRDRRSGPPRTIKCRADVT